MTLRDAEYITCLAEIRSITKAADKLGITQPSLSKFLSQLESRLKIQLFERQGKSLFLTYAGEEYVNTAMKMIDLNRQLDNKLDDISANREATLRIGITPARSRYVLPNVLPAFRRLYPHFTVEVLEDTAERLDQALMNGQIQLAFFTMQSFDSQNYIVDKICTEQVVLCTSREDEGVNKSKQGFKYPWINIQQFSDETFLVLHEQTRLGRLTKSLLQEYGMNPHQLLLSNVETAINLAIQGYGVCLCSEISFADRKKNNRKVHLYSVGNTPITWDFVIARRNSDYCSLAMENMIRLCKEIYQ